MKEKYYLITQEEDNFDVTEFDTEEEAKQTRDFFLEDFGYGEEECYINMCLLIKGVEIK